MQILSKNDNYAVVFLTDDEIISLGTLERYAVIDTFFGKQPLLDNIIGIFPSADEAEDWALQH